MFKDDKVVKAGEKESPYKSLLVSCLLSKCKGNNFRKSIAFEHNITRIVFFVDSTNTNLQRKEENRNTPFSSRFVLWVGTKILTNIVKIVILQSFYN